MVPGEVIYNLGGSKTISVRIRTFGNEGDADFDKNVFTSKIETIEIKAGCQFPAYSYAVAGGAVKAYTIDEDIRLVYEDGEWTTPYNPVSIPEANAAEDGTKVEVSGTVAEVNTAWSTKFNNMTVTLVDAEGNELYVYRLGTQVTLGDVITVKGKMGSYNGSKQVAQGSKAVVTGHDDKYAYAEMTAAEAIAAAKGTAVSVTGTVVEIGTAYADKNDNISVYVVDEAGTKIYVYRLSGNVEVGQLIKVSGVMDEYKGAVQVVSGSYEALGMHECSNFTDGKCIVCGADEPIPEYVEVYLQPGENTITMAAGQYAMAYMRGAGKFTFTWTGEATIMAGRMPIANGDVVEYNPMMGAFKIAPVNAEAECTVVLTIAEYVAPTPELVMGENAIESDFQGIFVKFTATEAGKYALKVAEGEANAWVDTAFYNENFGQMDVNWSALREDVFSSYEFTAEAGEVVWFWVSTWNEMADTVNLVIEAVADEPIDPPTSEEPIDPPTSSEPATSEPDDSSDEPTSSEPTTSEPTTSEPTTSEPEAEKKGGCGSVIGGVSAALTLVAAAAIVMKKKED
jgi:DNA/RNA endonuclease YhcR with UshA esterase domain